MQVRARREDFPMHSTGSTIRSGASVRPDLTLALLVSTFVFLCALAWGSPFVGASSAAVPAWTQQSAAASATFTGTILRNGEQFVLRDPEGHIFRLDDPRHAQPYEGKAVKVTGTLDTGAKLIHVERIEPVVA
jgi:hypothetical protein